MFWIPSARAVRARSVIAEKRHALPPDAVHIGVYSHPFSSSDFLTDLEDVLARLARITQQEAANDEGRRVAT